MTAVGIDPAALTASLRRLASDDRAGEGEVLSTLQRVVDACVDLFAVTGSGVMVADEQNITRYVAATDGPGRLLETFESDSGEGPCTEAFVMNRAHFTADLRMETARWPKLAAAVSALPVRAVLGVPVRLGGVPIGTLDVYRDQAHEWEESEQAALLRYADVVEAALTAALQAHTAGQLAEQLQYALDYRVVIERAVGYLMAREHVDSVTAFNRLRRATRDSRIKIGQTAEHLLRTGRLRTEMPG